ncbi:dihydroorotate oxidase [Laribacter hongkongensis]|uniref:dihydroorotate oxidase n=1 Tax=Laribacter hongkongensis TaxID=168471 RepID=UPI001EFD3738|nr:dihydroorotate oxidase [Laribacter hongkongensis]MCG9057093.1 dihydroorotate oxidase [Laribacter hongkongensis]
MTDISTVIVGHRLASPVYNASGVMCREIYELEAVRHSDAGAIVTKSCTLEARDGNPEPRYASTPYGSINSMGLPNHGYKYYMGYAKQYDYETGKPLFVSVSGLSLADNLHILREFKALNKPLLLEVNLSCPNVPGKPQLGYSFDDMEEALKAIDAELGMPFGVKLPPYFDISHFEMAAAIFNRFENLAFLTCINSVGNGLVVDVESETVVIKPKNGFGGIGGDYVLPTALANVNAFHRLCPGKQVIGCGGIKSGAEVFQHILCGASAVQVGTCLWEEGAGLFYRLNSELSAIMERKGYRSLEDFRGKVRTL